MGGKNHCLNHKFTIFSRQFPGIFPFRHFDSQAAWFRLRFDLAQRKKLQRLWDSAECLFSVPFWFQRMTSKHGCREQINKTITGWWFQPTPLKKYE